LQYKNIPDETLIDIIEQVMPVLIKKLRLLTETISLKDEVMWFQHIMVEEPTKYNIS